MNVAQSNAIHSKRVKKVAAYSPDITVVGEFKCHSLMMLQTEDPLYMDVGFICFLNYKIITYNLNLFLVKILKQCFYSPSFTSLWHSQHCLKWTLGLTLNVWLTGITQEMINETRASTERRMLGDIQGLLKQGEEVNQQDSQGATLVRHNGSCVTSLVGRRHVFCLSLSQNVRYAVELLPLKLFLHYNIFLLFLCFVFVCCLYILPQAFTK